MVFAVNPGAGQFATFQARANGTLTTSTSTTASFGFGSATATGTSPTATSTTAISADHLITVGGTNGLVYSPSNITANPGDTVTFQFHSTNHTATQSSFAIPCEKLALTSSSGQVGFDSGFMPVSANATVFPTYTIQVNDTKPIWVYCRQTGHCGKGMVFSVNAAESGNTFEAFQAAAIQQSGTASSAGGNSTKSAGLRTNAGVGGFAIAVAAGMVLAL
jgi:plastocyanin